MFHSIRTPGPTTRDGMLGLSPSPRARQMALTEGGKAGGKLGDGRVNEGKRLFEELARKNATPKRALGDKSNHSPSKGASSNGSGGTRDAGPSKSSAQPSKGSQCSPTKSTSQAQQGKGKARLQSPTKSTSLLRTPAASLTLQGGGGGDQSYTTLFSPTPASRPAPTRTRAQMELKTPVAQLGRAGAARARMGELMDARLGGVESVAEVNEPPSLLTEEEEWPEIEYLPSKKSREIPHDLYQLQGYPTGAEMGALLSSFSAVGFAGKAEGDAVEASYDVPEQTDELDGLSLSAGNGEAEWDDGWDSAVVTHEQAQGKSKVQSGTSSVRSGLPSSTSSSSLRAVKTGVATSAPARKPVTSSVASARKPLVQSSLSARKPAHSTLAPRNAPTARPGTLSHNKSISRTAPAPSSSSNARTPARSATLKENSTSSTSSSSGSKAGVKMTMPRQMLGMDDELDAFVEARYSLAQLQEEEGFGFSMEEEVVD